jgi:hypothetical protein
MTHNFVHKFAVPQLINSLFSWDAVVNTILRKCIQDGRRLRAPGLYVFIHSPFLDYAVTLGRTVPKVIRCRLLTAKTLVRAQSNPCWFCGGPSGTGAGFSPFLCSPPLITISPFLHTHLSPPHEVCDSPDQAAHYHTLGAKLGASSLTQHLAGLGVKVSSSYFMSAYIGDETCFEIHAKQRLEWPTYPK